MPNFTGYPLSDVDSGFSSLIGLPVRFIKKIQFRPDGCWQWTGATHHPPGFKHYAYGLFAFDGRNSESLGGAHRFSYESIFGAIPEGLEIDHACNNKLCVNPSHLRAVTHKENCSTRRPRSRVPGSVRWLRDRRNAL